jgi:hypothetical protein
MTAQIIHLNESTRLRMRIKRATKAKCEPGQVGLRHLIRADAEQAIQELEMDGDLPEMCISFGISEQWRNCCKCYDPIRPSQDCAVDHNTDACWCMKCWRVST